MYFFTQRLWRERFAYVPLLILLLCIITAGVSAGIRGQLLVVGEWLWEDYLTLRKEISVPDCDPNPDIASLLQQLQAEAEVTDELDFFDDEFDAVATRAALEKAKQMCRVKHQTALDLKQQKTIGVKIFSAIENTFFHLSDFVLEQQRLMLLITLFFGAFFCSWNTSHIALRAVNTKLDFQISSIAQIVANTLLAVSAWRYYSILSHSDNSVTHLIIYRLLIWGFIILIFTNLLRLINGKSDLETKGNLIHAVLSIPIYCFMAFSAANYFFFTEKHLGGVAIYVSQLFEHAEMFLNIGLYIWVGMLLKQTRLGELVFNLFKPWNVKSEALAFIAIIIMALPTAYTGASGIIIIATGVVVYQELRRVGTRRQLALATTAMTGSSGVVLRPCLLVVLIAALNKEVVTDELYYWGKYVFFLTVIIFFIFVRLTKKKEVGTQTNERNYQKFSEALRCLLPYVLISAGVVGFFTFMLEMPLNEFSAPIVLPILLLSIIYYEQIFSEKSANEYQQDSSSEYPATFQKAVSRATSDAAMHIGALIILMALSFCVGGVIERSEILYDLPISSDNIWFVMTFLLVSLVIIGMIMDPFGAVVLVTGTIATVAYNSGIHPIHFWMVTLVAFELGYLTPPVALNHLLTRQVVGEREVNLALSEGGNFWYRHERFLLPLCVMGISLVVVAYLPFMIKY